MNSSVSSINSRYNPQEIEQKWQAVWEKERVYSPDLDKAKKPFYNLMMFPYPSAEGMHVGNMYAFTGSDVYGRFQRMQGKDVFEPIGLDGFGIHSENYAIKQGTHPAEQAKISEKNFYRQLRSIGNGFDWTRTVETYKPEYYKWTQWLFIQLFKAGLAYRKKAPVNFCPSCKTVLADEQVEDGKCERCNSVVEKRDLDQWFFKITNYADRLLNSLTQIDWSEKVKIAQRLWIGKSEGALINFPLEFAEHDDVKPNFIILHGYKERTDQIYIPWLKNELEKQGFSVQAPQLPNTDDPREIDQVDYVIKNCQINEQTVIVGHSLGGIVAMKALQKINRSIAGLVLVAPALFPSFRKGNDRPFSKNFIWEFDYEKLKKLTGFRTILADSLEKQKRGEYLGFLAGKLSSSLCESEANRVHFTGKTESFILKSLMPSVSVFTTRADTLFGATFLVLSPEHPLIKIIDNDEVRKYVEEAKKKSDIERAEEKTGVFSGLYAINPVNNKKIPVWVADFVIGSYGAGAVFADAHDERDFEFAKKYKIALKPTLKTGNEELDKKIKNLEECFTGDGILVDSAKFTGLTSPEARKKIVAWLNERGYAKSQANYHLRDWLISRQRYWGPPIPMIFCQNCADKGISLRMDTRGLKLDLETGKSKLENQSSSIKRQNLTSSIQTQASNMSGWFPVPEDQLPVELPFIKDYKPLGTGAAPLASHPEFCKTKCPKCGGSAKRETDVSDTFLDSAWYFLRYVATDIDNTAFDVKRVKKWLPVNMYIGGAEHSVLHLLYSRFITMTLHDLGLISFEEPFTKFRAHGLIIKDGAKMSKSKGNVVVPDTYIKKFGADSLRAYLMFSGPFSQGGDFRDSGIEGMFRFLKRVWALVSSSKYHVVSINEEDKELDSLTHRTIKAVTEDIESLSYNTAIAHLMEYYNALSSFYTKYKILNTKYCKTLVLLLAPFAPHMTEELFSMINDEGFPPTGTGMIKDFKSIHKEAWPTFDEKYLVADEMVIAVQVNGKLREALKVQSTKCKVQSDIEQMARESAKVKKYLDGKEIKKVIYVEGKVINFVVN